MLATVMSRGPDFPVVLCPMTGRLPAGHFEHPRSEAELIALIREARRRGQKIRVVGSGHSVPGAIYGSAYDPHQATAPARDTIVVMLDRYRDIEMLDGDPPMVRVQAGRNIGADPFGPRGTQSDDDGLVKWLDDRGYALPEVGGITHQTLAGFVSTGSAGASTRYSFEAAIEAIRLIDGTGQVHVLERDEAPDLFRAAGVSMGLLGIISQVTLRVEPRYGIAGSSPVSTEEDCELDLFGRGSSGKPSVEQFFRQEEYARLLWWPQRGVRKIVLWKARRIPYEAVGERQPYEQLEVLPEFSQRAANLLYRKIFSRVRKGRSHSSAPDVSSLETLRRTTVERLMRATINFFLPTDGRTPPQEFRDTWWQGIPTDNQISDELVPVNFTELWLPLERAQEAMCTIRDVLADAPLEVSGTMCLEVYATGRSEFWLSAAQPGAVLRIDPFVFSDGKFDPMREWYPRIWDALKPLGFRFHWGKALSHPTSSTGVAYRRAQLPRLTEFCRLREQLDPDDVFLSDYWSQHLGIVGNSDV